jgi:hypothetical protein
MFRLSFADTSTKPFSHFVVTSSLVLSVSICNFARVVAGKLVELCDRAA